MQESDFRHLIRSRFQASSPSEADQALAQRQGVEFFQLTNDAARRVVGQEAQDAAVRPRRQAQYRQFYADLATDGRVETHERALLQKLSSQLQLDEKEVAVIEAAFKSSPQLSTPSNPANRAAVR